MILFFTLVAMFPGSLLGQISERAQGVRIFLDDGRPEQAIAMAETLLKNSDMAAEERMTLLSVIVEAEYLRATAKYFKNIKPAIQAIEVLLKEFPNHPHAAQLRWQRTWLWWNGGDSAQATKSAREIIIKDQNPDDLQRAWLLLARIHIKQENYANARSDLLQYGLQVENNSYQQATGMAWMSIVDKYESRTLTAYNSMRAVYQGWPDVITSEPILYSAYIHLTHLHGHESATLKLANAFIKTFISTPQAASIKLIRADIHAGHAATIATAVEEYSILANRQAETAIGRKAFLRMLMLQSREEGEKEKILSIMATIKKVADQNQFSLVEDEAMLDLARLWVRLNDTDNSNTPSAIGTVITQALHAYAYAGVSAEPAIASAAQQEGAQWLKKGLGSLLEKQLWIQAITTWRQFPQLRPAKEDSQDLRFNIAHAMRMLMMFDHAEDLLNSLYEQDHATIRGQRTMMELAKLWMDRQDQDAVEKIMRWLNDHEYTLYRPEMLVTVARIQWAQDHIEAARQTIKSVQADDIAVESRAGYWKTRAEIAEALSQWHAAAKAWAYYRHSTGADSSQGLLNQAVNLFAGKEYARARKLYQQVPENKQDAAWLYHMGVSQIYSGETQQGKQRLQKLTAENESGTYATLARLMLAEQVANALLGVQP